MVTIKATDPRIALKSAGSRIDAFLVFGTEPAQISELVKGLSALLSGRSDPAGEIIRLSDQDLSQSPGRLASEARSLPMFGGRPVLMVKAGPQLTSTVFEELLAEPSLAASIIIEAGNLKKDAKLRKIFEKASNGAAIGCYGAGLRDLQQLIREDIRHSGMAVAPDALERLSQLLGADWSVVRSEIAKLVLYADGEACITLEHVEAVVGDSSAHAFDLVISETMSRNAAAALRHLDGVTASGTPASVVLTLLIGHLQRLHAVLSAIDSGESFEAAVGRMRPPLHFRQKDAIKAQTANWRLKSTASAIESAQNTLRQTRLKPWFDQKLVASFIMSLE